MTLVTRDVIFVEKLYLDQKRNRFNRLFLKFYAVRIRYIRTIAGLENSSLDTYTPMSLTTRDVVFVEKLFLDEKRNRFNRMFLKFYGICQATDTGRTIGLRGYGPCVERLRALKPGDQIRLINVRLCEANVHFNQAGGGRACVFLELPRGGYKLIYFSM
uniref:PDZ domain-containing protein n=1 Tax=Steinernema glaseri TaxID=37863 RepID=A0A1I7Y938_9BILA